MILCCVLQYFGFLFGWLSIPTHNVVNPAVLRKFCSSPSPQFLFPGSVCPFPILPTLGQPCTLPGALDCYYDEISLEHSCCGRCRPTISCVTDASNTSAGVWQLITPVCPVDCCGSGGEIFYLLFCMYPQ